MQRSIKIKFSPLGSHLKSAQMHLKPLYLVKELRSYEALDSSLRLFGRGLNHLDSKLSSLTPCSEALSLHAQRHYKTSSAITIACL